MSEMPTPREIAWQFLLENSTGSLPFNPRTALDNHDIRLISYEKLAKCEPELFAFFEPAGKSCSFTGRDGDKYIAVDSALSPETARMLVTKELGHFLCNHIGKTRGYLNPNENYYKAYTDEALEFARRILCPSIVLCRLKTFYADQIAELCGIPRDFAAAVEKHMSVLLKRNKFLQNAMEIQVYELFKNFIDSRTEEETDK